MYHICIKTLELNRKLFTKFSQWNDYQTNSIMSTILSQNQLLYKLIYSYYNLKIKHYAGCVKC